MYSQDKQSKNNLKVLTFGFLLILAVVAVFFLKNYFFEKKDNVPDTAKDAFLENIGKYKSVSATDLLKKIDSRKPIVILDIRNSDIFQMEHIIDSLNIPASEAEARLTVPESKEYFVVDDLGLTPNEIQAMEILAKKGFNAAYLEGGFNGWKNQLNPTISYGNPGSFTDQAKASYIKSDELKKALEEENLYIIDLRPGKEFNEGHLKGAANIQLADLEKRRKELPIDRKIILYDQTGFESFQGVVRLFDLGILNAYALSDGLVTWKQKGFELVK